MNFRPELAAKVMAGEKTVTRRLVSDNPRSPWFEGGCSLKVGHDYAVCPGRGKNAIGRVRISSPPRVETLADITEAEARREGVKDVEEFFDVLTKIHGTVDRSARVWRVEFALVTSLAACRPASLSEKLAAERAAQGLPPLAEPTDFIVPLNDRQPRELAEDSVQLGAMLEGAEPPLALASTEVEVIIGRPPSSFETGEGYDPGFPGVLSYCREHHLTYRRDDGRELHYVYEGALVYALIESDEAAACR